MKFGRFFFSVHDMVAFSRAVSVCTVLFFFAFSVPSHAASLATAIKFAELGDMKAAIKQLNDILKDSPDDVEAMFLKATFLTDIGKLESAKKLLEDMAQDHPDLPELHNNLAVIYASQGRLLEAKIILENLVISHQEFATGHVNLADVYTALASEAFGRGAKLGDMSESTRRKVELLGEVIDYVQVEDDSATQVSLEKTSTKAVKAAEKIAKEEEAKKKAELAKDIEETVKVEDIVVVEEVPVEEPIEETEEAKAEPAKDVEEPVKVEDEVAVAEVAIEKPIEETEEAKAEPEKDVEELARVEEKIIVAEVAIEKPIEETEEAKAEQEEDKKDVASGQPSEENELLSEDDILLATVQSWSSAWQAREIEDYAGFYSESFVKGGKNKKSWVSAKRRKFKELEFIEVRMENIKISAKGSATKVRFIQHFKSNKMSDVGIKILFLKKEDDGWKIVGEEWTARPSRR